jgi:MYXO-CTERM domain-containing protein
VRKPFQPLNRLPTVHFGGTSPKRALATFLHCGVRREGRQVIRGPFVVRFGRAFVLAGLALLASCAVGAPAPEEYIRPGDAPQVARERAGLPLGAQRMMPRGGLHPDAKYCSSAPDLQYYGGPVLQNPKVYSVNWGTDINSTVTGQMPLFYADVLASPYFDWLSEYGTVDVLTPGGQQGTNQGIGRGSFMGSVTIIPSLCPGTGATRSCAVTDPQIAAELVAQMTAGNLPPPTTGCDGRYDTVYMVNFNASVQITKGGLVACNDYCAYHSPANYMGHDFAYAVLTDFSAQGCADGGCGPVSNTVLQTTTSIASHELAESITNGVSPRAWWDTNCGEIGDICEFLQGSIDPSGTTWTVQQLWSNAVNDCITTKASLPPVCTAANTPAGCRPCACSDDTPPAGVPGCGGATPWCETDTGNIDHGFCVQCTGSADCTTPATCTKSAVAATDDTCSVGVGTDAGVDAGSTGDASAEGGDSGSSAADSGVDGGDSGPPGVDAGGPGVDAGAQGGDSGSTNTDSGTDGSPDASASRDASLPSDAAADAGTTADAGDDSAAPGRSGGCGCRTADGQTASRSELLGLWAIGMIGWARRRRRAGVLPTRFCPMGQPGACGPDSSMTGSLTRGRETTGWGAR